MKLTTNESRALDLTKVILLFGVLLIHSYPAKIQIASPVADAVMSFWSASVSSGLSVAAFFLISGYLFFLNTRKPLTDFFRTKISKRVSSLLMPYVAWCTIYMIVRIFKAKYLGMDGDGVVVDGEISVRGIITGFWDTGTGYPIGFAMWFVRNLMVLSLLTPAVYLLARNRAVCIACVAICLAWVPQTFAFYGISTFFIGAAMAIHGINITRPLFKHSGAAAAAVFIACISIDFRFNNILLIQTVRSIAVLAGLHAVVRLSMVTVSRFEDVASNFLNHALPAYFFVYCFHGMFCTAVPTLLNRLIGYDTTAGALTCYLLTPIIYVTVCYAVYLMLARTSPRLASLLSGNRIRRTATEPAPVWDNKNF